MGLPDSMDFLNGSVPGSLIKPLPWGQVTPASAFVKIARGPYSFLLESTRGTESTGRYSFVGTDPFLVLRAKGTRIETLEHGIHRVFEGDPLEVLQRYLRDLAIPSPADIPPFYGGAVGLFSYDLARRIEVLPSLALDDLNCPDLAVMFVDTLIAFDHQEKRAVLVFTPAGDRIATTDRTTLMKEGLAKIDRLEKDLWRPSAGAAHREGPAHFARPVSNMTKEHYVSMVRRCKDYIAAGDIYQANLSQRFSVPFHGDPWMLYRILSEINPSPFAAFLQLDDLCLISASPERLIRLNKGLLETRPIAGTRPRGDSPEEDSGMICELLSNEKECAEHLMLVDLERNDLGKVCRYGSVHVDEFMVTERYSHVIHIVSNIRGDILPEKTALDAFRAVFPGGTVTGVPKIRCLQIIEELEPVTRGPYTGSLGYVSFGGEMDMNIIIRTFVIKNGRAHIQVGGGIVADSNPDREYEETLFKAEALLKALNRLPEKNADLR